MTKKERLEIKGMPGMIQPVFSDAVHMAITVKEAGTAKNKERNGFLRLTFIDTVRQQVLSEVVLDHIHARDFLKVLSNNVKVLDQAIKKGKIPKTTKKKTNTDTKARYIN